MVPTGKNTFKIPEEIPLFSRNVPLGKRRFVEEIFIFTL